MNDMHSEHQVYVGEYSAQTPQMLSSTSDLFVFLLNNPSGLTDEQQLRNQIELLATGSNLTPEVRRRKSQILRVWSDRAAAIESTRHKLEGNEKLALQQIVFGATQASLLADNQAYSAVIIQKDPSDKDTVYEWNYEPQDTIHASFPVWFALTKIFNQRSSFNGIHIFRSKDSPLKRSAIIQFPGKEYILHLLPIHMVTRQILLYKLRGQE